MKRQNFIFLVVGNNEKGGEKSDFFIYREHLSAQPLPVFAVSSLKAELPGLFLGWVMDCDGEG